MAEARKRSRTIEFPTHLTDDDVIDVKLFQEGKEIVKFSLSYRTLIKNKWREVYRIDSYHDYVHEQKFWVSDKPIKIQRFTSIVTGFEIRRYLESIKRNFKHYRSLFHERWFR